MGKAGTKTNFTYDIFSHGGLIRRWHITCTTIVGGSRLFRAYCRPQIRLKCFIKNISVLLWGRGSLSMVEIIADIASIFGSSIIQNKKKLKNLNI